MNPEQKLNQIKKSADDINIVSCTKEDLINFVIFCRNATSG